MARADTLSKLYSKAGTALEFNYQNLTAPPLRALIPQRDIDYLYKIMTSIRYNSKMDFKESEAKKVFEYNGFRRLHAGTHRVAWRSLEYPNLVVKISMNKSSLMDNIREYQNQFFLQPFCTKVFEVDPTGLLGLFERVDPIQSKEEYLSVAEDIFDFLNEKIIGKYIVDDIGTESFMNIGLRSTKTCGYAFGPVLLDFPEIYPLDGDKLFCNSFKDGMFCGGVIDYDAGFNHIYCKKCGREYGARELQKLETNGEIVKKGVSTSMVIELKCGDEVIETIDSSKETEVIETNKRKTTGLGLSMVSNPRSRKPFISAKQKKQMNNAKRYAESDAKYIGTSDENVGEKVSDKIEEAKEKLAEAPKEHELDREPVIDLNKELDSPVSINVDKLKNMMNGGTKAENDYAARMETIEPSEPTVDVAEAESPTEEVEEAPVEETESPTEEVEEAPVEETETPTEEVEEVPAEESIEEKSDEDIAKEVFAERDETKKEEETELPADDDSVVNINPADIVAKINAASQPNPLM